MSGDIHDASQNNHHNNKRIQTTKKIDAMDNYLILQRRPFSGSRIMIKAITKEGLIGPTSSESIPPNNNCD